MPHGSKMRKVLVSLTVKRSTISEISKELLNDIFAEFDRGSTIKNINDNLNRG